MTASVRRPTSVPNAITSIFLGPVNDIDFLRRFGECSRRWVVGDIGAAIDIKTVNDFSQVRLVIADPAGGVSASYSNVAGRDLTAAAGEPR